MTQKTGQRWMLNNRYHIEDMDEELVICNDELETDGPYLQTFLYHGGDYFNRIIANTDINLKKYRNSLINEIKPLTERTWIFARILKDVFEEDHMCKYFYTHEHISRNISKKVWNDVIDRNFDKIESFIRMIERDIVSHLIRELKNVKSNRDLPAFYKSIQTFMLEKYMEKHGRKRLQKALKNIVEKEQSATNRWQTGRCRGRKAEMTRHLEVL